MLRWDHHFLICPRSRPRFGRTSCHTPLTVGRGERGRVPGNSSAAQGEGPGGGGILDRGPEAPGPLGAPLSCVPGPVCSGPAGCGTGGAWSA